jgi:SNF2 family DNA or RNA helicase
VNVEFRYGELVVQASAPQGDLFQREGRKLIRRDPDAENAAMARLMELGCQPPPRSLQVRRDTAGHALELAPRKLPHLVGALVKTGWRVEAEGKLYRQADGFSMSVRSGVDWFDLGGGVVFNGKAVGLPRLLEAVRRKENTVILDDGSLGVLPETWLKRFGLLLSTGQVHEDQLRFRSSQVLILDALLAAEGENKWDKTFEKARASLRRFDGIKASAAPKGFNGRLRPYQEEGLGWLEFLQGFGFGGCLADDMGLGKTIQVLAMLESRRRARGKRKSAENSSLVVVPRSLIFNWLSEAARFTPKLRILDYTGPARVKEKELLERYDVVLTTYGTMRSDVTFLKDIPFDYVVLDESQAIKNSASQAAKAARLLQGRYRLGMSGTPIENHLGELWSLFEFLNPGMLGSSKAFKNFAVNGKPAEGGEDQGANQLLAHVIRPFILRRTKQEVAKDLPEKVEQTVFCDLKARERKLYDEVREFYRASLLGKIETAGLKRVKIQVLEALLRLRQAACHPGLLDRDRQEESSTKLELLLDQLREVHEENHKALVFSQFTSLLAIARQKLDADNITYEYLDGRTRNRGARVERFQSDPDCKLFLISLKAGGLGLNLTAAEYIFLLDPWWNPAVESQAIDRAHRIGQRRRVFAYRLIARDTVEEKVLELQQKKRRLADAIISGDGSILRDLTREDLEFILS